MILHVLQLYNKQGPHLIQFCHILQLISPVELGSTCSFCVFYMLQIPPLMAINTEAHTVFLPTVLCSLLCIFCVNSATESDIYCLKSIKESLEDPHNCFSSWDFTNSTEGFICGFVGVECWHPGENKVLNLRLSDMRLKGQFPSGVENCTSITGLDLSSNELQGPIPSDISERLRYITSLDLSFNSFSGQIPSSIANCTFLNVLKLDHNQLTGNIPPQIAQLDRLEIFSVADNLLSGPVPEFVDGSSSASYTNNHGLCGGPLEPCKGHRNEFYSSFKTGFGAGFTVFAVVVCFLSFCVPWVNVKRRNKMMRKNIKEADNIRGSPTVELLHGGTEISMLEKKVPRMDHIDLNDATNDFSKNNVIGQGKYGMLYKAALPNGYLLAVKKLPNSQFLEEQFILELKTLGILRHVNLLPLLGFCITSKYRLLVYKYMPNGNLYDWLHPMEGQTKIMEWSVRFKVAIGLARGLAWLHQDCRSSIRVIHLNISAKCILLDQNFEPKLSNFGEAIIISPTSMAYVNGESWDTTFAKEDVYGLGIVLLELITGVDFSKKTDSSSTTLNEWLIHFLNRSNHSDAIDKSLIGKGFDAEIFQVLGIACNCVHTIPDQRPTMLQVYEDIGAIRERCGLIDDSEILMQHEISPASSKGKSVMIEIA